MGTDKGPIESKPSFNIIINTPIMPTISIETQPNPTNLIDNATKSSALSPALDIIEGEMRTLTDAPQLEDAE
jgi:hypothetical protein